MEEDKGRVDVNNICYCNDDCGVVECHDDVVLQAQLIGIDRSL